MRELRMMRQSAVDELVQHVTAEEDGEEESEQAEGATESEDAENDAVAVDPFGIVAPETTVTPFTVTSTALPFHPSP